MQRTQNRPLVTGVIAAAPRPRRSRSRSRSSPSPCCGGAPTCCRPCSRSSAAAFYVGVYTIWLKRTSRQNIVIGGAAGAVPVLVGWAAVTGSLGWAPVVLFVVMFFWTPPHFWALAIRYADDYRAADVPMLPAVAPLARGRPPDDRLHGRARRVHARAGAGRRSRAGSTSSPRSCSAPSSSLATIGLARRPDAGGEHGVFTLQHHLRHGAVRRDDRRRPGARP